MLSLSNLYVFILACSSSYVSCLRKVICNLDDEVCLTKAGRELYDNLITGEISGVSAEPLNLDIFKTDLPAINYTLRNATLTGMKDCTTKSLKISKEKLSYIYYLQCPHLTTEAEYEVSGILNNVAMEGKGTVRAIHDDYDITYIGNYDTKIDSKNNVHVHIINFTLQLEAKGKVSYKFENLFDGDVKKSDEFHQHFSKENWKTVDEILGDSTMTAFQQKCVNDVLSKHLEIITIEDLFSYHD